MPSEKKGRLTFKEPKRTLNLPHVIVSGCSRGARVRLRNARPRGKDGDFVFTNGIGTPIEPRNVARAFDDIVGTAKLLRVRVHDLRHTAATLLLAQGVHPRVVMELMGHSQIAVTMNTYSHVVPARKEAADTMHAVLTAASKPVPTKSAQTSTN